MRCVSNIANHFIFPQLRALNKTDVESLGIHMLPGYKDPYHGRPLTKGELGCFLSHYNVWKEVRRADSLVFCLSFQSYFVMAQSVALRVDCRSRSADLPGHWGWPPLWGVLQTPSADAAAGGDRAQAGLGSYVSEVTVTSARWCTKQQIIKLSVTCDMRHGCSLPCPKQIHRQKADADGPPWDVCAQHPQSGEGGLFLLDARLPLVITRSSEAPQGRASEQDASCGWVPPCHVQQASDVSASLGSCGLSLLLKLLLIWSHPLCFRSSVPSTWNPLRGGICSPFLPNHSLSIPLITRETRATSATRRRRWCGTTRRSKPTGTGPSRGKRGSRRSWASKLRTLTCCSPNWRSLTPGTSCDGDRRGLADTQIREQSCDVGRKRNHEEWWRSSSLQA